MQRINKADWKNICACEYVGVELNVKRTNKGWEDSNKKATVFRISDNAYCFYDPLETKGSWTHLQEKVVEEDILKLLEEIASRRGIKVYTFDSPEELNDWLMD